MCVWRCANDLVQFFASVRLKSIGTICVMFCTGLYRIEMREVKNEHTVHTSDVIHTSYQIESTTACFSVYSALCCIYKKNLLAVVLVLLCLY